MFSDPSPERDATQQEQVAPLREINSTEIMQGNREMVIRHGAEAYRLSVTRSGKLILRK